jgi:hypothetical protein
MKLTFEGNEAFIKKIEGYYIICEQIIQEELQVTIDDIYNEALRNSPADFGAGGGIRSSGYKDVGRLEGEVGFKNEYAPYVEFGTGTKVKIPAGLEDYAMTFYVNGEGRLPASPFLFPAYFKNTKEFLERIRKEMENNWGK